MKFLKWFFLLTIVIFTIVIFTVPWIEYHEQLAEIQRKFGDVSDQVPTFYQYYRTEVWLFASGLTLLLYMLADMLYCYFEFVGIRFFWMNGLRMSVRHTNNSKSSTTNEQDTHST